MVAHENAIQAIPEGQGQAKYLNNLAICLQQRFQSTHCKEDIDRAILMNEEVLKSTANDHPLRAGRLNNLGSAYRRRYNYANSRSDLDTAIAKYQEAVRGTSEEHQERGRRLDNLGSTLQKRFILTGSLIDLNGAIEACQGAVDFFSDEHPDLGASLHNLAVALHSRAQLDQSSDDWSKAVAADEKAARLEDTPPRVRAIAAKSAAYRLISKDIRRASALLCIAVNRLPEISPRTLTRRDQQGLIAEFAGLTTTATAALLSAEEGKNKEAAYRPGLELLERGRGFMASLQLDTRTEVTDLENAHPELAQEFKMLQDKLDAPMRGFNYDEFGEWNEVASNAAEQITVRYATTQRFSQIIVKIRQLQSFGNFLKGPTADEMMTLARDGPIVVVNIAASRSDAFIITTEQIACLHLPLLHQAVIAEKCVSFMGMLDDLKTGTYNRTKVYLRKALSWLWEVAAGPILFDLGYTDAPKDGSPWPKVWWVLSGWLNVLPIHASGLIDQPTSNVLERIVSVYIPTLKSLSYSRAQKSKAGPGRYPRTLFISMPETPGKKPLRHVIQEVADLEHLLPATIPKSALVSPLKFQVQSQLSNHEVVHFACHGEVDVSNPSKSLLLFRDWQSNAFSVTDMVELRLEHAQMAYLSACHSGKNRVVELFDEGIHLAGACQLAGFSHVCATLWQIEAEHSVTVAKEVYRSMITQDGLDLQQGAEGLHAAVLHLRKQIVLENGIARNIREDPLVWAPYIYLGT
jgi:tetratricopeptide (TPR) repeat protein